jgi:O-antigen/teichoic acid export membrane protein
MTAQLISSGVLWLATQTVVRQVISFSLFVVLGRLLDPVDFGIVGLCTSIVLIMQTFSAQGIVGAVIQKPNLTDDDASVAYTFSLIVSWSLFAALVLAVLLFAHLYLGYVNLLCWVLMILAFSLPISALYEVHQARLIRTFRFDIIAKKTIAGNLFSGVVAVVSALLGYGVWSLVIQQFVMLLIELLIVRTASQWKPSLHLERGLISHLFRFGAYIFGSRLLMVVDTRSPDIFIGAYAGPLFVGYFRIARSMFEVAFTLFTAPIIGISLPLFSSKQAQSSSDLRKLFLTMCEAMCWLLLPPFFTLVLWAPVIIETLFGEKWQASGWVLQLLAIQILVYATLCLNEPLLTGLGRTQDVFKIRCWQTGIGLILLVATAPFGFLAMILGQVVAPFLATPVMYLYVSRALHLDLKSYSLALWRPIALATAFAATAAIVQITVTHRFGLLGLIIALTICYICYCVSFYFFATLELRQHLIDNIRRMILERRRPIA